MTLIKVKSRGTDNVSGRRNLAINGGMQIGSERNNNWCSDLVQMQQNKSLDLIERISTPLHLTFGQTASQEAVTDLGGFPIALKLQCYSRHFSCKLKNLYIRSKV